MAITSATFTPADATMLSTLSGKIPSEQGTAIVKEVMGQSLMMQLAQFEPMTKPEKEFDLFMGGLAAYWVGEGQRIKTTKATWGKAKLTAKKLGVILPVSREYLSYKQADFFEFMKPHLAEALYKKFDAATILGVDNPFEWSVQKSMTGASHKVTGDITADNVTKLVGSLNDAGYEPNAYISTLKNNTTLRSLVVTENTLTQRLYDPAAKTLDGVKTFNVHKDITEMKKGLLYAGDFNKAYYGIPYNMTYLVSEEATLTTIQGDDGQPVNLFERDMAALRVTMDVAFMIVDDQAFAGIEPAAGTGA